MLFPEEVWIQIFMRAEVPDILTFGCTCTFLKNIVDSEYLWKWKWAQLASKCELDFARYYEGLDYKKATVRLYGVLRSLDGSFVRCKYCRSFTCQPDCLDNHECRIAVDIGNKFTWIVAPNESTRRHQTMYGFPRKQPDIKYEHRVNGPFCMFCNSVRLYREKKRVFQEDPAPDNTCRFPGLHNGFCRDSVKILGTPHMDIVSPAAALLQDGQFPVVQDFIAHLFRQMQLVPYLRKPNTFLIFCEPLGMSDVVRTKLLDFFFQTIQASRVCLVSKPFTLSVMMNFGTCIVVDSGALCTSVAVISNRQVVKWKNIPVGGWHVSENLKEGMQWHPEDSIEIPVSYLDNLSVKEKCWLSLNFSTEERRKAPARREDIRIRVDSYADYKPLWYVSLGAELYTAPELMYTSLGLPEVIHDLLEGLSEEVKKDCLRHIVITGGNTELRGFKARLAQDLRVLLPDYRKVVDVKSNPGTSSWCVANSSTYVDIPRTSTYPIDEADRQFGKPIWITREEYILHGW